MVQRPSRFRPALLTAIAAPLLLAGLAAPALAADATIDQVYAEAKAGNVQGALGMMDQVLKDHPNSAKAHYAEAELLAHAHRTAEASAELAKAEQLKPGLPGISPRAVGQLKAEIARGNTAPHDLVLAQPVAPAPAQGSGIPWFPIIIVGLVIFGMLALLRRRAAPVYGGGMAGPGVYPQGTPGYGAPGYGPGYGGDSSGGGGDGW